MLMRILFCLFFCVSLITCSPVKFKSKTDGSGGGGCNDPSCVEPGPGPFQWRTGEWGSCSSNCNGMESRTVVCVNPDDQVVPDEYCKTEKPKSTRDCNTGQNCNSNAPYWWEGGYGDCIPACGLGVQTQTVECRTSTGKVPDNQCTDSKPPTEKQCNTPCSCTPINKTTTYTVPSSGNKVDILVVVDDSSSMTPDNEKLAARLSGFVTDLQNNNLDWQMCITTTDVKYYEGRPIVWSGTSTRVVNKATPNLSNVFQQTIYDIGSGYSNDEQGIKASILSLLNNPVYPCYRPGAAYASIIISDEDERSVGGNASLSSQQYQPLGIQNQPATFVNTASMVLGQNSKMVVNTIIVKDNSCKQIQDPQGSPSFIGVKYMELSNLTDGSIGSICDIDYSTNLKYFKNTIVSTAGSVDLECIPTETPSVSPSGLNWSIDEDKIIFTPALPAGTTVQIQYKCCP